MHLSCRRPAQGLMGKTCNGAAATARLPVRPRLRIAKGRLQAQHLAAASPDDRAAAVEVESIGSQSATSSRYLTMITFPHLSPGDAAMEVPDASYNLVAQYANTIRGLPLWAGTIGIVGLLLNRIFSGVAPVVDASSSQSRADVLGIGLCAVLVLTGLQWLSLKPKTPTRVVLEGKEVMFVDADAKLPTAATTELRWAHDALQSSTRCRSIFLVYQGRTVFHAGSIAPGARPGSFKPGPLCAQAMASGQGNYLANLTLYPGRTEFTGEYLPANTQGVVIQPIGSDGVLVAGTDTLRGISRLDQAWIAAIADKLEVTLEGYTVPQPGIGFSAARAGSKVSKP